MSERRRLRGPVAPVSRLAQIFRLGTVSESIRRGVVAPITRGVVAFLVVGQKLPSLLSIPILATNPDITDRRKASHPGADSCCAQDSRLPFVPDPFRIVGPPPPLSRPSFDPVLRSILAV